MKSSPLVSIICTAYNHEEYIKDALEGFLMQKTDFPFEIIVHDDASTDRTAEIIKEYEKANPQLFVNIYQTENQYSKGEGDVGRIVFSAARGKYIALCEGDDYWIDPYKLQKQVDFLERNKDFAICFHNVKVLKEKEQIVVGDFITRNVPEVTDIYELAKGNYIHTPSVVFRNNSNAVKDFKALVDIKVGDYPLHMLNSQYGKIVKISEYMAVYRYGNGIWSGGNFEDNLLSWLEMLNKLCVHFENNELVVRNLRIQYGCQANTLFQFYRENNSEKSISFFNKSAQEIYLWQSYMIENQKNEIVRMQRTKAYRLGKFLLKSPKYLWNKLN